ncbi:hypothetical protein J6590_019946 [Homalodisca vitripennis]|nr:hypothetical protein J6590_019946 [Homalodisca vitripennis]
MVCLSKRYRWTSSRYDGKREQSLNKGQCSLTPPPSHHLQLLGSNSPVLDLTSLCSKKINLIFSSIKLRPLLGYDIHQEWSLSKLRALSDRFFVKSASSVAMLSTLLLLNARPGSFNANQSLDMGLSEFPDYACDKPNGYSLKLQAYDSKAKEFSTLRRQMSESIYRFRWNKDDINRVNTAFEIIPNLYSLLFLTTLVAYHEGHLKHYLYESKR